MNEHDSERIAGMLEKVGYKKAEMVNNFKDVESDIVIINTCAVRENAATRLYGNLGQLLAKKRSNKKMIIGVGGCLAQLDKDKIIKKAPWVDIVFGTNNLQSLPALIKRVNHNTKNAVEISQQLKVFPSTLPTIRQNTISAWVPISVGCNQKCTFCIVPQLRGQEIDRQPEDILNEIKALVNEGFKEIILLGQNVNSYGLQPSNYQSDKKYNFSKLLNQVAEIKGLQRLRFMSPHPAGFTDDVIQVMAKYPNIMPAIHLPLQSGSNKVLKDMKRSYRINHFKRVVNKLRLAIPDIEITTDIIVGFPTETQADFEQTLKAIKDINFLSAYTFIYSIRPNTPAGKLPQLNPDIIQKRFNELTNLQSQIMLENHKKYQNKIVKVLVENIKGRKDKITHRLTGRDKHGILVHFTSNNELKSGQEIDILINKVAPSHLLGHHIKNRQSSALKSFNILEKTKQQFN
jgi:tRNA-2-methylthio-N6-dimethylallyladenosine synthase